MRGKKPKGVNADMLILKILHYAVLWFCVSGVADYGFKSVFGAAIVAVYVPYLVLMLITFSRDSRGR